MLESLAATLLNRLLGAYVENFDPAQLNVGIWSGDVVLKNLKLRNDCLDELNLPINLRFGVLGNLVLTVPWSSLKNKPVKISVEECYMLCVPKDPDTYNSEEELKRELSLKLKRLFTWEQSTRIAIQNDATKNAEDSMNESFIQSLLTKIVDNLQVTIKNIHIRYEDMQCELSKDPSSFGLTLSELSAISTDSDWKPSFISITQEMTYKLLTLNSLCVYWNTNTYSIQEELEDVDSDVLLTRFKELIVAGNKCVSDYQYILKPINGSGRLTVNKRGSTEERPHLDLQMLYDEFSIVLDDEEYTNMLQTLSRIQIDNRTRKFRGMRPRNSVEEDPRGWLRYTAQCVLQEVHEQRKMWTWSHIKQHCDDRRLYIKLWLEKLQKANIEEPLTDAKKEADLLKLHTDLSYDDIILFRTIARKMYQQLRGSRQQKKEEAAETEPSEPTTNKGWFSSFWRNNSSSAAAENEIILTDEQRDELYAAIDFKDDDTAMKNINIPKDRVTLRLSSVLNRGSLSVKYKNQSKSMAEMIFENCKFKFLQRPDSFVGQFSLDKFKLEDGSPNTIYKHIISVKKVDSVGAESDGEVSADLDEPLFFLRFERNPLDKSADSKVDLKLLGMTIFYHAHFITAIMKFFSPSTQHTETVGAIVNAAEATVEGWTTQTRMGVEALLEDHKTVDINLDIQAPLIIAPLDPHIWNTPCAIIDAGHITVTSDLLSKEKIKLLKDMSPDEYSKLENKDVDRLVFDRYKLYSQDTQILIGSDVKSTISALHNPDLKRKLGILDKMRIELLVDISILPKAYSLPRVKTYGRLPDLNLAFDDLQYKIIMQLIEKSIPSIVDTNSVDFAKQLPDIDDLEEKKTQIQLNKTIEALDKMTAPQIAQSFIEVRFDIESLKLSVQKCTDSEDMSSRELMYVISHDMKFEFARKAKEMDLDISVHSVNVIDSVEGCANGDPIHLVSPERQANAEGDTDDLFRLRYKRQQRIVLHKGILIEVFDQDVAMDMEQLKIIMSPKSYLTLLNFVLTTFTDPSAPQMPADVLRHNSEDKDDGPQKINVHINMAGITTVFMDSNAEIARLVFKAGEFSTLLLPESMKVHVKLDGLELIDETDKALAEDSFFKKLVSVNENDVTELIYETFDPATNTRNYDSQLSYNAASIHMNFVEDPINQLVNYFYKFQRMKTLFERARDVAYNQTPSMETVNNVKLLIMIKSPVITFPRFLGDEKSFYDTIELHLGDFFLQNHFSSDKNEHKINHINLGIKEGQVSSLLNLLNKETQEIRMIDNISVTFDIDHNPLAKDGTPELIVRGYFDSMTTSLTELQLQFLLEILQQSQNAFIIQAANTVELDEESLYINTFVNSANARTGSADGSSITGSLSPPSSTSENNSKATSINFRFEAPEVSLKLYNNTADCTKIEKCGLACLKLQNMGISLVTSTDGAANGKAYIESFTIDDIRDSKENKHTELIPKVDNQKNQFSVSLERKALGKRFLTNINVNIGSPTVILAMDYIFALKLFFEASTRSYKSKRSIPVLPDEDSDPLANRIEDENKFQYIINIVDASAILLADPSDVKSEALVFKVGQILLSDQNITTMMINNVGVFLTSMNASEDNKVRLLDDFSSSVVKDSRGSSSERLLTSIQGSIQPLIMRISLRDIRLAIMVFNRVMRILEASRRQPTPGLERSSSLSTSEDDAASQSSEPSASTFSNKVTKSTKPLPILEGEAATIEIGGLRLVLIGDVHEMPILDLSVDSFDIVAKNWSGDLDLHTTFESHINVFNYSRTSWEPLLESVPITLHLSKGAEEDSAMLFDIITSKIAELTLSSRSISMLSHMAVSLKDPLTLNPRGSEKPYILHNDTEFDLEVWILSDRSDERKGLITLEAHTSVPWEFEDWRSVRERLDIDNKNNCLGVSIAGGKYKTIIKVDATNEGETVFVLEPPVNGVHNRLACFLDLGEDNIKTVSFRSTLSLENTTNTPIQFRVENGNNAASGIYTIEPAQTRSVPVSSSYMCNIRLRPLVDTQFGWAENVIFWKDLLSKPVAVQCIAQESNNDRFYMEVSGKFDEREPLARIYPHMKIIISSPITIENLLPYDLKFSLFDKREAQNKFVMLEKGQKIPVHDISLDNFLLLCVQPLNDNATLSKPSIINTPAKSALEPESSLALNVTGGQKLYLKIHYQYVDNTRAKVLKIFSPYLIFNATDRDLFIQSDTSNTAQSKLIFEDEKSFTIPKMFSFLDENSRNNRARIKVKDSDWSIPISFDALGQSFDVSVSIPNKNEGSDLGVSISKGHGVYALSKLIEISPRYIIFNDLDKDFDVKELGARTSLCIGAHQTMPLYKMGNANSRQLQIKFTNEESAWSAPFFIKDIGMIHLKVLREKSKHMLLKVEIVLDKATIFIRIRDAENVWPFSVRNYTENEFIFYQRDPRIVDEYFSEEDADDLNQKEYKPLFYRVPPKSIMPYAWDFPAARQKKLILTAKGRKREVQLAEIGALAPMRFPNDSPSMPPITVDLNVVADGITQALVITNYKKANNIYKLRDRNSSSSLSLNGSKEVFEPIDETEKIFRKIVISFKGLGISLINAQLQELLYVTIRGIELRFNDSDLYQTFSWKLKWLQVDNQLYGSVYQNILYPTAISNTLREIENHPVLSGSISKVKDDSKGIVHFKHVTLLLQELSIHLDEDFLFALIDFSKLPGSLWNSTQEDDAMEQEMQVMLPKFKEVQFSEDIYFEIFHIQPTMLHLSFVRSERINTVSEEEEKIATNNQSWLLYLLNILTMTIGNVNDAPIKMNSLYMDNVRVPVTTLVNSIATHYGQQFIYQLYKILGSADFLGNPVGLFNTISSGVWDMFYEPYKGYIMNDRPQEIGIHLAKGGLSFAKKTVFGLSDSMAKVTGSVAKGLSVTQDLEFQESRRLQQRINSNSRNVLARSAQSFATTVGSGFTGMALDPYKGAQKEGASGFIKGIGKGLFGLPTKTAIGFLDLTNNLSQGIKSTTTLLDVPAASRMRLARYVPHDQIIRPYKEWEAQGQYWLKTANGGIHMADHYLTHVVLPGRELTVIVSMEHIVEVRISTEEIMWDTSFSSIQGIVLERTGIHIKLKTQAEYFIPIADSQERKTVYQHIAIAVTEYNKYCEAVL